MAARFCAAVCVAMAWFDLDVAVWIFDNTWNKRTSEPVTEVKEFLSNSFWRLFTQGDLRDFPRTGRPQIVDDEMAKECAQAFKAGYAAGEVLDQDLHVQGTLHKFYTCMTEAVRKCPLIRNTLNTYNVSPEYLLRRMKEVDPNLRHIRLDYKMELNDAQRASRVAAAYQMRMAIAQDNSLLDHIIWVDEWHCWCSPEKACTKVWCDAHDARATAVLPIPQHRRGQHPIVVRCIAFVNALLGAIHIEFTTGTTGLQRELNPRPLDNPYIVSYIAYQMLP